MVTYVTVASGIEGYNPPDYYRTLETNNDIEAFFTEIRNNGFAPIINVECKNDVFNGMGRCTVNYLSKTQPISASVILIRDANYYIVGKIDSWEFVAEGILEFKYTIDWYTSTILMCDWGANAFPKAKTILYRRLTNGEFIYSDEGLVPTKTSMVNNTIKVKLPDDSEVNFFDHRASIFMVYHEKVSNTDHWIVGYVNNFPSYADLSPAVCWSCYCDAQGVSYAYDPDGLMFFGELPFNPEIILNGLSPIDDRFINNLKWYVLNKVEKTGSSFSNSSYPTDYFPRYGSGAYLKLNFAEEVVCTDYYLLRLVTGEGNCIWEIPKGKAFPNSYSGSNNLVTRCYIGGSSVAPYFVFTLPTKWWYNNAKTFTIAPLPRETFKDSLDVYYSQERQYSIDMRNLQSLNECVSGVIGGANQGAMISAFSRTGARTGKQSLDKGFIGGGVAVASSLVTYGYEMLYANKQATEIEDKYNRNKPDTLAMAGGFPSDIFFTQSGLYIYKYDDDTIANIQAYQSVFGYQTNKIETDVELNHYTGYVQADIMFERRKYTANQRDYYYGYAGLIEKYIKDMFNYGVYFTKVV